MFVWGRVSFFFLPHFVRMQFIPRLPFFFFDFAGSEGCSSEWRGLVPCLFFHTVAGSPPGVLG